MGLGGILVLLALLVTLIVFIYLLVLTARGWGVLHTVMLCFLFIECWVFMFLTAGVHYERVRATKAAFAAAKDAKDSMARTEQLLNGDFTANPEEQDGLLPLKGQLRRMTADRGRVWREVTMLQSANDQYLLEMPVAKPADDVAQDAAPAAAAPNSESLPQNLVVYAFAEEKDQDGTALPKYYLGEFLVTSSQAGQVSQELQSGSGVTLHRERLDEGSIFWVGVQQSSGAAGAAAGYFELTIPPIYFPENPRSFSFRWIDFYRE